MKFTVSQSALSEALAVVTKGMASTSTCAILSGIYIKAEDGMLVFHTTNLTISIRHKIAANVEDVKLSGSVTVKGTNAPQCEDLKKLPSYVSGSIKAVSDAEFEQLLGHDIPDGHWAGTIQPNDAIAQLSYAKSLKARRVWKVMDSMLQKSIEKGEPDLNITFIYNMPIRAIGKMAGGMCSQEMCDGILDIINGHGIAFCKGLGKIVGGFFKQMTVSKKQKARE
jgi:beta-glucosidase